MPGVVVIGLVVVSDETLIIATINSVNDIKISPSKIHLLLSNLSPKTIFIAF
jgi:hypothetical protein